jgi:hypothetical protein
MNTLMFAVGTPISGSQKRTACIYFRLREFTDTNYVKIQYGTGCSASVSTNRAFRVCLKIIDWFCQR